MLVPTSDVLSNHGKTGRGKSLLLDLLQRDFGGTLIGAEAFIDKLSIGHPLAIEEAFYDVVAAATESSDAVCIDDFHLLTGPMTECHFYPRSGLLGAPLVAVASLAGRSGKKLIFSSNARLPDPLSHRCTKQTISAFTLEDYRFFFERYIEYPALELIDFDKVFRFAPKLNGHQLKATCRWLSAAGRIDTETLIEYLRSQRKASNVELGEVDEVDLHELCGVEDVIEQLETNVVVPLEHDELAKELDLAPKRGVLLAGPPGTGKTTVGRALAHRLQGKFFLIDGTFISGTRDFYSSVQRIFEAAKENAPAVIVIDDSDVIFEGGEEHGLYRYLLTMLDGLESKSAHRVWVMMTAMDIGNLPPALVRSGRIELWLEMRLPNADAHRQIIDRLAAKLPPVILGLDSRKLADATEGFTGADLKRTIDDGMALYAYNRAKQVPAGDIDDYFARAIASVEKSKANYAAAETRANQKRCMLSSSFSLHLGNFEGEDDD